jgi:hypothetical protein
MRTFPFFVALALACGGLSPAFAQATDGEPPATPPPPTAPSPASSPPAPTSPPPAKSRYGALVGVHVGAEFGSFLGQPGTPAYAVGVDAGMRFARNWYVGGVFEQAEPFSEGWDTRTNALGAVVSFIAIDPDRLSFDLSLGVVDRWPNPDASVGSPSCGPQPCTFTPVGNSGADVLAAIGLWVPVGSSFRLVPEITGSLGTFPHDANGHAYFMIGVAGLYNVDE